MASTLLAAAQQGQAAAGAVLNAAAALVSRAIDEGFVRLAVAKRKAVERAAEQLSSTSISPDIPGPPAAPAGIFTAHCNYKPRCHMLLIASYEVH